MWRSCLLLAVTIVAAFLFLATPANAYADYWQYIDSSPYDNYVGLTATGMGFTQTFHHLQCYAQQRAPPSAQSAYSHLYFSYSGVTDTYSYNTQSSYVFNTSLMTQVSPDEPARSFFCLNPITLPYIVAGNYWGVFGGTLLSSD